MKVVSDFHGGNIERLAAPADGTLRLRLVPDPVLGFRQWFHFAVEDDADSPVRSIEIDVAGALVPAGWPDYQAFVSHDRRDWSRTATRFSGDRLVVAHAPSATPTWYAYFPPYPPGDFERLIAHCRADARAQVETLCMTGPEDRLDAIGIGSDDDGALRIWVIGRQHPGEVQASWWMEGFVRRLLDRGDGEAAALLAVARLHVVPNMNPDGSRLGLHRTNRHGRNLNAAWDAPSPETAPAVHAVLGRMVETGVDFCLDVHGDEELPYVFVANVDRVAPVPDAVAALCDQFQTHLARHDPNFLAKSGRTRPHTLANPLGFCGPQIMRRFGRPAATLELPYKKFKAGTPEEREYGVAGCIASGRAALTAILEMTGPLRAGRA